MVDGSLDEMRALWRLGGRSLSDGFVLLDVLARMVSILELLTLLGDRCLPGFTCGRDQIVGHVELLLCVRNLGAICGVDQALALKLLGVSVLGPDGCIHQLLRLLLRD